MRPGAVDLRVVRRAGDRAAGAGLRRPGYAAAIPTRSQPHAVGTPWLCAVSKAQQILLNSKAPSQMESLQISRREIHRIESPCEPLASGSLLPGFSQLVLEGRFLEACRSISSSAEERQDRGCQYQAVARGMWQVVQEALEGGGGGRELQRKLRSVAAAMEWARGASRELGGDLASWDCQLQTRLRNDAENRVPPSPRDRVPLNPRDQLGRYLVELAEAMDRGLGPQRAARLGACLSATDRECFQEVLLGRLSVLLTRSGDPDSCQELYTWARKTLFGQLARKTPRPAAARKLLDPLMFVTWMSQMQSRLVELIQLWKGTIDSVQDVGLPVTSRVQAMVLNTFAEFLQRKTWQDLGQAHTPLADLVLCTINAIEDQSQDALVSGVRSLCQSLLGHHFGREDEELARALRSLRQGLERYPGLLPPHIQGLAPRQTPHQSISFASCPEMPVTIVLAEIYPVCSLANVFTAEDQPHVWRTRQTFVLISSAPAGRPKWRWK
ncbi:hypothetical protein JEQ12_008084 [Ovis aries]|uniref:Uncharacterized protein n=1 Tax=Ovis aries TaxID=9940 RepID=A0A835ZYP4_SHEEP|nr:hypothetical protein JEQ12_008084 [Ovis aries]